MTKPSSVSIKHTSLNIGASPYFAVDKAGTHLLDEESKRIIHYRIDKIADKFPLIYCESRITECLEMNLFLNRRANGNFSLKQNKIKLSQVSTSIAYRASLPGEPLELTTIDTIAKDLRDFLEFIELRGFRYEHVLAAPLSRNSVDDEISNLPIWQYQKHLIALVKMKGGSGLKWSTASRRLNNICHFYVWSFTRGTIQHLPFQQKLKQIKVKNKNGDTSAFSLPKPGGNRGLSVWVSNLRIPKNAKQKEDFEKELQAYSPKELATLINTETAQKRTSKLFLQCAYLGGLRSGEIVQIDTKDICNPSQDRKKGTYTTYHIYLVRKFSKPVMLRITPTLMELLYQYTLDLVWSERAKKHQIKHGIDNPDEPMPLFLNSSGKAMSPESPSKTISKIRAEQREKGTQVIERSFHDLRATFGTYLVLAMIKIGISENRIRETLLKLFSHENFDTSLKYITLAKVIQDSSEHGEMDEWVNSMYSEVDKLSAVMNEKGDLKNGL